MGGKTYNMVKPSVTQQARKPVVLMADDSADQFDLVLEAFAQCNARVELHHVDAGDQCLAFLRRQAPFGKAPRPDLLLLDINMPRVDGYEVMEQVRADPALRWLPVVVFSTSSDPGDVRRMYALGCSSYIAKPVEFERLIEAARGIDAYWFRLALLPTAPRP